MQFLSYYNSNLRINVKDELKCLLETVEQHIGNFLHCYALFLWFQLTLVLQRGKKSLSKKQPKHI